MDARSRLQSERERVRAQHDQGARGRQACTIWTEAVDRILHGLLVTAAELAGFDPTTKGWALLAQGGYGRSDLAPYSDIDLALFYHRRHENTIVPLARHVGQMVVDAGLQLGFATRTDNQALALAFSEPEVFTSLTETRLLWGDEAFYERFRSRLARGTRLRSKRLAAAVVGARREERQKFGETNYLLQPNIKRSRGGLRDIQLVKWVGFARYGEPDLQRLWRMNHLLSEDYERLEAAYDYLLRLRNQLHFSLRRPEDLMDRGRQLQLALWAGFAGMEGILPVEQFMQQYFNYTADVRYASTHFTQAALQPLPLTRGIRRLFSRALGTNYRVSMQEIWPTPKYLEVLKSDPTKVIELMLLANMHNRRIDHLSWSAIREAMIAKPPSPPSSQTVARFASLMDQPRKLGLTLRRLHELRVLEQIIPAFKHARSLLQFNEYHKYTVDIHCIGAVEASTEFGERDDLLGDTYREIKNKSLLHLALLIHDLGKGFTEDHSEVGARIAANVADDLLLDTDDKELLVFLVHKHLLMTHTAFRYDLSDRNTILAFAAQVGSVTALKKLFVLSCADLAAVGPAVLNDWKLNLIKQLYQATLADFGEGTSGPQGDFLTDVEAKRDRVRAEAANLEPQTWWRQQIDAIPTAYLWRMDAAELIEELRRLKELSDSQPIAAWGKYDPSEQTTTYVVGYYRSPPYGTFARITGAITSMRLEIINAEIHSQPDDIVWDRISVQDPDYQSAPPPHRVQKVCENLMRYLQADELPTPRFSHVWGQRRAAPLAATQPVRVQFDNDTSSRYTIISIFAYDRTGLLFDISRVLYDAEVVLHTAKISTHLDQVVDVFYVTTVDGGKISEATMLYTLRQQLLKVVA